MEQKMICDLSSNFKMTVERLKWMKTFFVTITFEILLLPDKHVQKASEVL